MADRISDQCFDLAVGLYACSDVGIEDCGKIRQLVNGLENELLAARARIAKLEQEPPMAMIDFGVGINWKGLHEDMQRLRAERDEARAEVAEARRIDGVRLSQIASLQDIIRNDTTPAGVEVARFRAEVERLRCRVAVLERVRNEAEWVRKAYELDDNDDQGATDLCAALDAAKETDQ